MRTYGVEGPTTSGGPKAKPAWAGAAASSAANSPSFAGNSPPTINSGGGAAAETVSDPVYLPKIRPTAGSRQP